MCPGAGAERGRCGDDINVRPKIYPYIMDRDEGQHAAIWAMMRHTAEKSAIFNMRVCSGNQIIVLIRGCEMCCALLGLLVREDGSGEAPTMALSSFRVVRCR